MPSFDQLVALPLDQYELLKTAPAPASGESGSTVNNSIAISDGGTLLLASDKQKMKELLGSVDDDFLSGRSRGEEDLIRIRRDRGKKRGEAASTTAPSAANGSAAQRSNSGNAAPLQLPLSEDDQYMSVNTASSLLRRERRGENGRNPIVFGKIRGNPPPEEEMDTARSDSKLPPILNLTAKKQLPTKAAHAVKRRAAQTEAEPMEIGRAETGLKRSRRELDRAIKRTANKMWNQARCVQVCDDLTDSRRGAKRKSLNIEQTVLTPQKKSRGPVADTNSRQGAKRKILSSSPPTLEKSKVARVILPTDNESVPSAIDRTAPKRCFAQVSGENEPLLCEDVEAPPPKRSRPSRGEKRTRNPGDVGGPEDGTKRVRHNDWLDEMIRQRAARLANNGSRQ